MKKIFSVLLIMTMVLSLCPSFVSASSGQAPSGDFGDSITWTLKDNTLILSGSGSTYDFDTDSSSAFIDRSIVRQVDALVIEEGITHLGKNAFVNFYNLSQISFPKSLETIGEKAFEGTSITSVSFPEESSLKEIGKEAFRRCSRLETLNLSACRQLQKIDAHAFLYCGELSSLAFPSDGMLSEIAQGAFWGCDGILQAVLPESVVHIGENAFYGCFSLHYVAIPENTRLIGQNAFCGTQPIIFTPAGSYAQSYAKASMLQYSSSSYEEEMVIREGTLSNGIGWAYTSHGTLTISGNGAMEDFASSSYAPWYRLGYKGLKTLVISEGITHIGRENFAQFKNLRTVTLPATLKTIGMYAFIGCDSLEKLILPEGFAGLGDSSLYACSALKELVIPSSMYHIGEWALYGLDSIQKYTVSPSSVAFSSDENGVLYNGDKTALIKYPAASPVKAYTIPASVREIYPNAFNGCSTLEEVYFGENSALMAIGQNSFSDSAIRKIIMPQNIKFIGEAAFDNCYNLEHVLLPEGVTEIKEGAFRRSGITAIKIPGSVTTIGNGAFLGCEKLENIAFSEGLSAIGASAFQSCLALKELNLPQSLSWLDPLALYNTTSLAKITVCDGNPYYSTDEYGALYYDKTELLWYPMLSDTKSYTIPEGVTKLNHDIFWNADKLEEVVLPSTVSTISAGAFRSCSGLKTVTIPKEITEIGAEAFRGCVNLAEVIFAEDAKLSVIGARAFHRCRSLKEIAIPDSVVTIQSEAFGSCTYLESIRFSPKTMLQNMAMFTGSPFVTVYAPEGSAAYNFAQKHRMHTPLIVNINGEKLLADVPPVLVNNRTMIPMRAVFEALDADVSWDDRTQTATAVKGEVKIEFTVDSKVMFINGKECTLDSPAFVFEERTMIPVRAVSEALGYAVLWNQDTKTVDITSK